MINLHNFIFSTQEFLHISISLARFGSKEFNLKKRQPSHSNNKKKPNYFIPLITTTSNFREASHWELILKTQKNNFSQTWLYLILEHQKSMSNFGETPWAHTHVMYYNTPQQEQEIHTPSQDLKHVTFACLFINKRVGNNKLLLHVEL